MYSWDTARGSEDGGCGALLTRLKEISEFRSTHNQLMKLLSEAEQKGCGLSEVWGAFSGVQCLQCNDYATPLWDAAKSQLCKVSYPAASTLCASLTAASCHVSCTA